MESQCAKKTRAVTKEQLLGLIDLLAKRIEDIFTDGLILTESDTGQILALKSKLERKQAELASIRKLIQRLKANTARQQQAERQRK